MTGDAQTPVRAEEHPQTWHSADPADEHPTVGESDALQLFTPNGEKWWSEGISKGEHPA